MHRAHVDTAETVPTRGQTYHREVHHRLPCEFG